MSPVQRLASAMCAFLVAAALTIPLAGCGGGGDSPESPDSTYQPVRCEPRGVCA